VDNLCGQMIFLSIRLPSMFLTQYLDLGIRALLKMQPKEIIVVYHRLPPDSLLVHQ
jgi:hypothetical protein